MRHSDFDLVTGQKGHFIQQAFNQLFKVRRCSVTESSPVVPPVVRPLPADVVAKRAQAALNATFPGDNLNNNCTQIFIPRKLSISPKCTVNQTTAAVTEAINVTDDGIDKTQHPNLSESSSPLIPQVVRQLPSSLVVDGGLTCKGNAYATITSNRTFPARSGTSISPQYPINTLRAVNLTENISDNALSKANTPSDTLDKVIPQGNLDVQSAFNELFKVRRPNVRLKSVSILPPVTAIPDPDHVVIERAQAALRNACLKMGPQTAQAPPVITPPNIAARVGETTVASTETLQSVGKSLNPKMCCLVSQDEIVPTAGGSPQSVDNSKSLTTKQDISCSSEVVKNSVDDNFLERILCSDDIGVDYDNCSSQEAEKNNVDNDHDDTILECFDSSPSGDISITNDLFKTILQKKGASEAGCNDRKDSPAEIASDEKLEVGSDCSGVVVRSPVEKLPPEKRKKKTAAKSRSRTKRRGSSVESSSVPKKRARKISKSSQKKGNTRNKKSGKPPEQNKISLKKSGIRNSERIKTLQAKQAEAKKKNDEARNYVHYNVRTAKGKFIPANKRYSSKSRTKPVKKQKTVSSNEMRKSSCHCRRNSGVDDVNGNRASDVETRDSEEDIVEISGDSSSVKYRAISRDSSKALSVLSELEKLATMPLDELLQSGASGELFRRPEMGPIGNSPIKETLFSNTRGVHRGGVWNSIVDES